MIFNHQDDVFVVGGVQIEVDNGQRIRRYAGLVSIADAKHGVLPMIAVIRREERHQGGGRGNISLPECSFQWHVCGPSGNLLSAAA